MNYKFVKLKRKERIGKKVYNEEQVNAPDFTDDYGRLINCGYVIFDFDNSPYKDIISKIITKSNLKCKKLTTTRGYHFMFKTSLSKVTDKSHEFNWIGLECDIKGLGTQQPDKKSYQAIKVNGIVRQEEFLNGATSDEELDYAPMWLYHIQKKKEQVDLTIDQTGNRNDMFHRRTYD
jgi:hypothetical protein